jgi:hypothetical protein
MALKPWCYWSIGTKGDGTSTSATYNLLTSPFMLSGIASGSGVGMSLTFQVALSNLPSSIEVIGSSDGQTVTGTVGLLGAITFTWPTAIPNGDFVTMYGRLIF